MGALSENSHNFIMVSVVFNGRDTANIFSNLLSRFRETKFVARNIAGYFPFIDGNNRWEAPSALFMKLKLLSHFGYCVVNLNFDIIHIHETGGSLRIEFRQYLYTLAKFFV